MVTSSGQGHFCHMFRTSTDGRMSTCRQRCHHHGPPGVRLRSRQSPVSKVGQRQTQRQRPCQVSTEALLASVSSICNMLHTHTPTEPSPTQKTHSHGLPSLVWPPPGPGGVVGARRCPSALRFTRCCLQQAISRIGVAVNQPARRLAAWP